MVNSYLEPFCYINLTDDELLAHFTNRRDALVGRLSALLETITDSAADKKKKAAEYSVKIKNVIGDNLQLNWEIGFSDYFSSGPGVIFTVNRDLDLEGFSEISIEDLTSKTEEYRIPTVRLRGGYSQSSYRDVENKAKEERLSNLYLAAQDFTKLTGCVVDKEKRKELRGIVLRYQAMHNEIENVGKMITSTTKEISETFQKARIAAVAREAYSFDSEEFFLLERGESFLDVAHTTKLSPHSYPPTMNKTSKVVIERITKDCVFYKVLVYKRDWRSLTSNVPQWLEEGDNNYRAYKVTKEEFYNNILSKACLETELFKNIIALFENTIPSNKHVYTL